MKFIEKSGSNLDNIIKEFCKEFKIKEHELKYEVIEEGSKGFLGIFGSKKAIVRFSIPELADRAKMYLEKLLSLMQLGYERIEAQQKDRSIYLEIFSPDDPGVLIGKNGSMLETIQFLLNRSFEGSREIENIYLDTQGYRARKDDKILSRHLPGIKNVKTNHNPLTLEPMSPAERRVIHRYVEKDKHLRTLTIGEGDKKRIVIFSAKQSEKEALSQVNKEKKADNPRPTNPDKPAKDKQNTPEKPARAKAAPRPQRNPSQRTPNPPRNRKVSDNS
ncbi:MAG: Jag N-terminal domain-containing protein [Candidatus Cloacimonetes bacterium]|nr:Jag N-terminal domain-containing protein [Candidatus Cloacimonadota bacterium]